MPQPVVSRPHSFSSLGVLWPKRVSSQIDQIEAGPGIFQGVCDYSCVALVTEFIMMWPTIIS